MNKKNNSRQINIINVVSDTVILLISYLFAMYLRFKVLGGTVSVNPMKPGILIAVAFISLIISMSYQAYKGSYLTIAVANAAGTLLIMAIFFMYKFTNFSRLSLVIFWALSTFLVILKHIIGHKTAEKFYGNRKKIVIGTGKTAEQYLEECGEEIKSFEAQDTVSAIEKEKPDEIIIALEPEDADKVPYILQAADKDGLYVTMVPFYSEYIPSNPEIESIGNTKLINLRATPLDYILNAAVKRLIDIVGSAVLIIITSPFMLITAIGVKLSSPGPVFFKQERVGKDKKNFFMLKFRSMRVNAEENTGWSKDKDPRRTKFGSFIRKYSIDELPQFINVLKGDMSLVGPRPEIPFYVYKFRETVPLYLVRQQVRPGITGWAQVNGLRGDTSIEDRVKYDIWYIENWSLWLDIKILFVTVFGGKFKNNEK